MYTYVVLAVAAIAVALAAAPSAQDVSGARALAFVRRLADMGPRVAGSPTEARAQAMVAARLRELGYRVRIQRFPLPRGGTSANVVGLSRGRVRAVVVAHLDGVSAGPAANDNGSGVAAMLEVAAALRRTPGVLVAALGAEERVETGSPLHLGSQRLVRGLGRGVRVALSLDMVGVGPTLNVRGIESTPNRSATLALRVARRIGVPATYRQDPGQSDHVELTRAGIPAAWIQWRWDTCWHSACDVASRVSRAKLTAAARLAVASARAVVG